MRHIQKLEDWMTFPEAARVLGMSKQGFHKLVTEGHSFSDDDLRKLGDKPTYVVRTDSVITVRNLRKAAEDTKREMDRVLQEVLADRRS